MRTRAQKIRLRLLIGVAAASLLVSSGLVPIPLGFLRGVIEERVLEATGIQVTLAGPIVARLGPRAGVRTGEIAVGAAGSEPFVELDEARIRIGLFALVRGRIRLRDAAVTGVRVDYCSPLPGRAAGDESGEASASEEPPPEIAVDAIRIENVTVRCGAEPPVVRSGSVVAAAPFGEPILVDLDATVLGIEMAVNATGGQLGDLLAGSDFPFEVSLSSEHAELAGAGHLRQPDAGLVAESSFEIDIADPPALAEVIGASLPATGALYAAGTMQADLKSLQVVSAAGSLGNTQFAGSGSARFGGERIRVDLSASLEQLDLTPFIGAGTNAGPAEAAAAEPNINRVFDALGAFDAGVEVSVARVLGVPLDVASVTLDADMRDGVIELATAHAELLGGALEAAGSLDTRADCPRLELTADMSRLKLAELRNAGLLTAPVEGHVSSARAGIETCGRGLSALLDGLTATLKLGGGELTIGEGVPLGIERLGLRLAPGEPTRVQAIGSLAGEQLEVSLAAGSLHAVLGQETWPVRLDVEGAGSELRVDGTASLAPGKPAFDIALEFQTPRAGRLNTWLGIARDAELPVNVRATLALDEARLLAEGIAVTVGSSDLGGEAVWHHAGTPDTFAIRLRSSKIDLEHIDELLPPTGGEPTNGQDATASTGNAEWRSLPPIDLDLAFDAIRGGRLDIQDLAISGHLEEGLIDNARVSVIVEQELSLRGELDLDVRTYPANLTFDAKADNANIGSILEQLEIVDDLRVRADGLTLRIASTGENARDIVTNSRIDAKVLGFAWDIPRAGHSSAPQSVTRIRLDQLDVSSAPERPIEMTSSGTIDEFPVDLWIRTPSLPDVMGTMPELPLRLVFGADDDVAMIDVIVDRSAEKELRARFELSGEMIGQEGRELATLEPPLADYVLRSNLTLDESGLELPDLEARLLDSTASGRFALSGDGRRRLDIDLRSPLLQTDDLQYVARLADTGIGSDETEDAGPDTDEPVVSSGSSRGPLLILNDLITKFQEDYDLDLHLSAEELRAGSDHFGSADLRLYIDENDFRLEPLTIRLPGGGVDAGYRWSIRDGRVDASLSARADWLMYGGLLRLANPETDAQGLVYLDVDLKADAPWSPDTTELETLLRNSDGYIKAAVWPEYFEAGILDLWTANLVFALLPTADDGEPSRLNCVVAHFEAKDGLLKARTAMLDSTETIVRGRGKIDLAQRQLDLLVTPQAKREKFLSASTPVKVTGPLNAPEIGLEPTGIFGTLIRWYYSLIYVPYKWLTGERFPEDGTATCFDQMGWELTPELEAYFRERDFSAPPPFDGG